MLSLFKRKRKVAVQDRPVEQVELVEPVEYLEDRASSAIKIAGALCCTDWPPSKQARFQSHNRSDDR